MDHQLNEAFANSFAALKAKYQASSMSEIDALAYAYSAQSGTLQGILKHLIYLHPELRETIIESLERGTK